MTQKRKSSTKHIPTIYLQKICRVTKKKKSHKWILKHFPGSKVSLFTTANTYTHIHTNQNTIQSGEFFLSIFLVAGCKYFMNYQTNKTISLLCICSSAGIATKKNGRSIDATDILQYNILIENRNTLCRVRVLLLKMYKRQDNRMGVELSFVVLRWGVGVKGNLRHKR